MVADEFGWAALDRSPENLGFGAAVNRAVAGATTPWIVAANADVELRPGALEAMLAAGEAHPRAAVIAPRLILADGSTQHSVHSFPSLGLALAANLGLGMIPAVGDRLCLEGRWDPERSREVDWAHGALLAIRRDAFEEVGGFDAAQWMYAEDLDLCWRLRGAGWTTRYEPEAGVGHELSAATSAAFGDERERLHMRAAQDWMVAPPRGRPCARLRGRSTPPVARCAWRHSRRWRALAPGRFGDRAALERRYLALHAAGARRRDDDLALRR